MHSNRLTIDSNVKQILEKCFGMNVKGTTVSSSNFPETKETPESFLSRQNHVDEPSTQMIKRTWKKSHIASILSNQNGESTKHNYIAVVEFQLDYTRMIKDDVVIFYTWFLTKPETVDLPFDVHGEMLSELLINENFKSNLLLNVSKYYSNVVQGVYFVKTRLSKFNEATFKEIEIWAGKEHKIELECVFDVVIGHAFNTSVSEIDKHVLIITANILNWFVY